MDDTTKRLPTKPRPVQRRRVRRRNWLKQSERPWITHSDQGKRPRSRTPETARWTRPKQSWKANAEQWIVPADLVNHVFELVRREAEVTTDQNKGKVDLPIFRCVDSAPTPGPYLP